MDKTKNRRNFLKGVALTGAALVADSVLPDVAKAIAPSIDPDLNGVIETHVHADPDIRARCIDQYTLTQQCRQSGYRAIMYKCHDFTTADNAYLLRAAIPGIEVFGGIALNKNYGDKVNVQAAQTAVKITGHYCRCIWMPTYQSAYDMNKKGGGGIPVVDASGKVLPEVVQVMELCAAEDIIFATGHSSPEECVTLVKKGREVGVKKVVVTHCTQAPWKISLDQAKECLAHGAFLEHSILPYFHSDIPGAYKPESRTMMPDFAAYIKLAPQQQFINTDLGQALNPNPIDGMRTFINGLRGEGITDEVIKGLNRKVPAYLLGLEKSI